jgi:hypothetical protein
MSANGATDERVTRERSTGYRVRLSEEEKLELHLAADRAGLELSDLIRALPGLVDTHLAANGGEFSEKLLRSSARSCAN